MKKKYIVLMLIILTSCWTNPENNLNETSKSNLNATSKKIDPKIQAEKRMNALLEASTEEQKAIFDELNKAEEIGDLQKIEEVKEEIRKMEEIKKQELDEAVKSWDNEKAKAIRKEMRIFSEVRY